MTNNDEVKIMVEDGKWNGNLRGQNIFELDALQNT